MVAVNHLFTNMLEIDRDPAVDATLHLSEPPIGTVGVAHKRAGNEERIGPMHAQSVDRGDVNDQPARLAALMASRICHDLVSPVGAIANGLELLELSGMSGPELDLIRESVDGASRRLKLFRIAFGAAAAGQIVEAQVLRDVIGPGAFGPKLSLRWQPDQAMERPAAKRLCLGLMCMETALPYGGEIAMQVDGGGRRLSATAERQRDCPQFWAWLAPGTPPPDYPASAGLHFAVLGQEMAAQGIEPGLVQGDGGVSFRI